MLEFASPWLFLLLPLPWILHHFLKSASVNETLAMKVPFFDNLQKIQESTIFNDGKISFLQKFLAYLTWFLLILAITGPQWMGQPTSLPRLGRDLMLAVDLSGSMETPDMDLSGMPATRLEVLKTVAEEFIKHRTGDRLGLILFGTRAYIQTPLTFDRTTVRSMLDDATIALAGPNTAIGDAIGLSVKHLNDKRSQSRVIILLTDGANNSGMLSPSQGAQLAKEMGIRVYTIGIGSDKSTVPNAFGYSVPNPSNDLDDKSLQEIANITGGMYFRAKDTEGLEQAYRTLDQLEPAQSDQDIVRPSKALYFYPLGLALLLSCYFYLRKIL